MEYESQLAQCYDGMQTVLARASNKLGCLQYAEAHRKRGVVALPNFQATCRASNHSLDSNREVSYDHFVKLFFILKNIQNNSATGHNYGEAQVRQ